MKKTDYQRGLADGVKLAKEHIRVAMFTGVLDWTLVDLRLANAVAPVETLLESLVRFTVEDNAGIVLRDIVEEVAASPHGRGDGDAIYRDVAGALRALRRAGRIHFAGKSRQTSPGWYPGPKPKGRRR